MVFRPAPSVTFEAAIGKTILQGPAYVTPPWFYVIQAEGFRIFGRERSQQPKSSSLIFDFQPYPKAAGLMPYRRFYLPSLVIEPLAPTPSICLGLFPPPLRRCHPPRYVYNPQPRFLPPTSTLRIIYRLVCFLGCQASL